MLTETPAIVRSAKREDPHLKRVEWSRTAVETEKRVIKSELDRIGAARGDDARLEHAVKRVMELQSNSDSTSQLRCYIFAISALVQHQRTGGLAERDIRRLESIAAALLQLQNIQAQSSRLAVLHGEFHHVVSAIRRKAGYPWAAAWEQMMSMHSSGREPVGGRPLQALSLGIRQLRLGFADSAIASLGIAAQESDSKDSLRARLTIVQALRLSGRRDEWIKAVGILGGAADLPEDLRQELEWERIAGAAMATKDLVAMVNAVSPKGSHRSPTYLLEAILWARASSSRTWIDRLPRVATLGSRRKVDVRGTGFLFRAAQQLEHCCDTAVPFSVRLQQVGECVDRRQNLISVEKELLFLAGTARWLSRAHAFTAASLVLDLFRALNLSLSAGRMADVMGLVDDLVDRSWSADDDVSDQHDS